MEQGWVSRVGARVRHALVWKPRTWPTLIASLLVTSVALLVATDLIGWYDLTHAPGPPLLLMAGLCGVQVYDFVRRRRERERESRRDAAHESQPPRAG